MPDIAMCKNAKCPLGQKCFRFKAKPNGDFQDYGEFNFSTNENGEVNCQFFWQIAATAGWQPVKNMSAKLSIVRTYEVENRIVVVPKSWKREAVSLWQTVSEEREVELADIRPVSLTEKREFDDGLMPICKKIEMEDFTVDDLPLELI